MFQISRLVRLNRALADHQNDGNAYKQVNGKLERAYCRAEIECLRSVRTDLQDRRVGSIVLTRLVTRLLLTTRESITSQVFPGVVSAFLALGMM